MRRLCSLVLVAAAVAAFPVRGQEPVVDDSSLADLRKQIRRVWYRDVAAWADYAFRRHVIRRGLDANDEVTFRQEMIFQITPQHAGFDELLLEIDGREPTRGEVVDHRRKQRFTNHYGQAAELELDNPLGENLALLPIIRDQEHRVVGEAVVGGVECHRTAFDSRTVPEGADAQEQLKYAIKGSACFSKQGFHLVEFEMETVRPVKRGAIRLTYLRMKIEGRAVGDAWLPKQVEVRSEASVLGKNLRKDNAYSYTDFAYQPANR